MKYSEIANDDVLATVLRGLDDTVKVPADVSVAWKNRVNKRMRLDRRINGLRWVGEAAAAFMLILCLFVLPVKDATVAVSTSGGDSPALPKYAYSDIKIMASGLSFIESDSSATEESAIQVSSSSDEALLAVKEPAGPESDPGLFAVGGDNLVITSNVSLYSRNVEESVQSLKQIASSYDTILETETSQSDGRNTSVYGKLRVRKDEAEEFLDTLKAQFSDVKITIESHDFDMSYIDASGRIFDLEDVIASLKARIDMAEQDEIEALRVQLSKARDELDSIRVQADEYLLDKEYMTVVYSISNVRTGAAFAGISSSPYFFAIVIAAAVALTVLITLHFSSEFRKRKVFA
ncbi:MAG: DUF4349 domain-containing protein [Clostridiales bacterium]|nr:DUF4349 domain-containing protein [Clostridiales bacterium]